MTMATLNSSVRYLKGIGESRAKLLEKLGIRTIGDLICYFPRDYEDRTKMVQIADMVPGEPVTFQAYVMTSPHTTLVRKGMEITKCRVADNTSAINLTFFNNRHSAESLVRGECYFFYGALNQKDDYMPQVLNPVFEPDSSQGTKTRRIMPIYRLSAGLSNNQLVRAITSGLAACGDILPDCLPEEIRLKYGLCHARYAYENIHNPTDAKALDTARKRLIFEEFFVFSAGLSMLKAGGKQASCYALENTDIRGFLSSLPFELTGAQSKAVNDVISDMSSGYMMNRLVQGDVGSGKTIVAAAAIYAAAKNGHQSALMAPTEILARQHYKSLSTLLEPLGIHVSLLTGSLKAAQRRSVLEDLALGQTDLVIGTHALISEGVEYRDLGLVVADEQHRFGVAQRSRLYDKGRSPHVLVMSATPIPRTLALMIYGDLEVSVIDELPPGRMPVETYLISESKRQRMYGFIEKQTALGHQTYIVCPMVDEDEQEDVKSVEAYAHALATGPLSHLRIGLVHGKLKASEKEQVMADFSAGKLDVLVSTTVIEVGVDVPNATLMIVENADRFGLSQLHQLRGRVGRGSSQSYCVLVSSVQKQETRARLKVLCSTNDGFKIAEEDLKLRGPGDFFGSRQHGLPAFKIADLSNNMEVLYQAKEAATDYLSSHKAGPALKQRIQALFSENSGIFN